MITGTSIESGERTVDLKIEPQPFGTGNEKHLVLLAGSEIAIGRGYRYEDLKVAWRTV